MSTDVKAQLLLAAEHAERSINNANYQAGYFSNSFACLYEVVKREAPHLISYADERAYLYARYALSGNKIEVGEVVNSEAALPEDKVIQFPRIARLPGAEI